MQLKNELLGRTLVCSMVLWLAGSLPAQAERPPGVKLLPKSTVVYVAVGDSKELSTRFQQTALGQMSRDPQLKPLVDDLYGTLGTMFETVQDRVGVSLSEIWTIPQGEFTFAVVVPEAPAKPAEGETPPASPPALVAILEAKDGLPVLMRLVDRGTKILEDQGAVKREEQVGETSLVIYDLPAGQGGQGGRRRDRRAAYFIREGVLIAGTDTDVLKGLLARWNGGEGETLAQNPHFAAIMRRSRGEKDEPPQVAWYLDPIAMVKAFGQGNAGAQLGLALLPTIGLDGLLGIGGSVSLATETFDTITHTHVLLDNPRDGVIEALAVKSGDITPERWVSNEVATYVTVHWDVEQTYKSISKLVDSFPAQGEGASARRVQQVFERTGLNFEHEILPALGGRFTYARWIEAPVTASSQASLIGLHLADAKKFQETFDKLVTKYEANLSKQSYGGKVYYEVVPLGGQPDPAQPRPRPSFCLLGDYLLVADRASFLHKAISTESDADKSLASSLEFKLISSKINRLTGGMKPGSISFDRPEEGMRFLYDLATADTTRDSLRNQAANNQFFRSLNEIMEKNPLPPFKVLQQYLAPGGAVLTDDETGFHYTTFTLKRKRE